MEKPSKDTATDDLAARFSTKRLAWAYGCAKKGSPEEARLAAELGRRVREGWKI